ncbi:MAG: ATP-binding protein [Acidobacteriota bacterium]
MFRDVFLWIAGSALLAVAAGGEAFDDPPGIPLLADRSQVVDEDEVWAIAQSPDGVLYFATGSGVVEYDGVTARRFALANESIARSLAVHASGRIYVGGIGEIGVLTHDAEGRLAYAALEDPEHLEGLRDVWRTWPTEEGFVAWTLDRVLSWDGQRFSSWPLTVRTMPGMVAGRLVVIDAVGELSMLSDGALRPAGRLVGLDEERVRLWLQQDDGAALLATSQGHLWRLEPAQVRSVVDGERPELQPRRFVTEADAVLSEHRLYDGVVLSSGDIALTTMTGGALVIDPKGRLLARLDRAAGLPDNAAWSLVEDRDGGVWLGLSRGLVRAALEVPFTAYDERLGLEGKVQAMARSSGRLWAATSIGLFRLDADGFTKIEEVPGPCWSLLGLGEPLLVGASNGVYSVTTGGVRQVHASRHAFSLWPSRRWPGRVWVGNEEGLAAIERGPDGWRDTGSFLGLGAQVRSIAESDDGSLFLGTLVNSVIRVESPTPSRLDESTFERLGPAAGLEEGNSIKLFLHRGQIHAATEQGLLAWSESAARFESGPFAAVADESIVRVASGADGSLWLSRSEQTPLWLGAADEREGGGGEVATRLFRHLPSQDVYAFLPESPERCWIGTAKGLFRLRGQPDDRRVAASAHRRLELREVRVDDRRQPLDQPLEVAKPRARLVFRWADPTFGEPRAERYRYRLHGLDEVWSEWTGQTRAEYMNLPGGDYRFQVQARDLTDEVFDGIVVRVGVPPPWYLTVPALVGWLACAVSLLWLGGWARSKHLRRERDRLELQVAQRTRDLEAARDEANLAAEAKSQFLATMSHEIRTPMNGVIGVAELLLTTKLEGSQRRYVEVIQTSANSLLSLIDDILDVAKIDAGEMTLEAHDFDLPASVESVIEMLAAIADKKGLELSWTLDAAVPTRVHGDSNRLRQVLLNLVGNAIKFTDAGRVVVAVRADADGEGGLRLRVEVRDTGIGISSNKLDRLFKPFSQVDSSRTRRFGGTGLGLMISKQLVELMGGEIGVDSVEGEGSRFWFTALVRAVQDPADDPVPTVGHGSTPKCRVLVVEDNPVNQLVVSALLQQLGHEAVLAGSGEQALEVFVRNRFDLVLMDIEMPEMDGLEAAARMRVIPGRPREVPIIAVTAHAMKGDRESFLAEGFDGYLAKPMRSRELAAVIETTMRRGESAARAERDVSANS